ncbi:hypothetical protein KCU65_g4424, partial [Aureobasidium melanogenum]
MYDEVAEERFAILDYVATPIYTDELGDRGPGESTAELANLKVRFEEQREVCVFGELLALVKALAETSRLEKSLRVLVVYLEHTTPFFLRINHTKKHKMAPTTRSAARKAAGTAGSPSNALPNAPASAPARASARVPTSVPASAPTTSRAPVHLDSTTGGPRRTVDDDPNMVMNLDGLKNVVKDDEDMKFLRQALEDVPAANIDVPSWLEQYQRDQAENERNEARNARVAAAPEGLKNMFWSRNKSGLYDSTRPVKKSGASIDEANKTDETPTGADETDPSAMEEN